MTSKYSAEETELFSMKLEGPVKGTTSFTRLVLLSVKPHANGLHQTPELDYIKAEYIKAWTEENTDIDVEDPKKLNKDLYKIDLNWRKETPLRQWNHYQLLSCWLRDDLGSDHDRLVEAATDEFLDRRARFHRHISESSRPDLPNSSRRISTLPAVSSRSITPYAAPTQPRLEISSQLRSSHRASQSATGPLESLQSPSLSHRGDYSESSKPRASGSRHYDDEDNRADPSHNRSHQRNHRSPSSSSSHHHTRRSDRDRYPNDRKEEGRDREKIHGDEERERSYRSDRNRSPQRSRTTHHGRPRSRSRSRSPDRHFGRNERSQSYSSRNNQERGGSRAVQERITVVHAQLSSESEDEEDVRANAKRAKRNGRGGGKPIVEKKEDGFDMLSAPKKKDPEQATRERTVTQNEAKEQLFVDDWRCQELFNIRFTGLPKGFTQQKLLKLLSNHGIINPRACFTDFSRLDKEANSSKKRRLMRSGDQTGRIGYTSEQDRHDALELLRSEAFQTSKVGEFPYRWDEWDADARADIESRGSYAGRYLPASNNLTSRSRNNSYPIQIFIQHLPQTKGDITKRRDLWDYFTDFRISPIAGAEILAIAVDCVAQNAWIGFATSSSETRGKVLDTFASKGYPFMVGLPLTMKIPSNAELYVDWTEMDEVHSKFKGEEEETEQVKNNVEAAKLATQQKNWECRMREERAALARIQAVKPQSNGPSTIPPARPQPAPTPSPTLPPPAPPTSSAPSKIPHVQPTPKLSYVHPATVQPVSLLRPSTSSSQKLSYVRPQQQNIFANYHPPPPSTRQIVTPELLTVLTELVTPAPMPPAPADSKLINAPLTVPPSVAVNSPVEPVIVPGIVPASLTLPEVKSKSGSEIQNIIAPVKAQDKIVTEELQETAVVAKAEALGYVEEELDDAKIKCEIEDEKKVKIEDYVKVEGDGIDEKKFIKIKKEEVDIKPALKDIKPKLEVEGEAEVEAAPPAAEEPEALPVLPKDRPWAFALPKPPHVH